MDILCTYEQGEPDIAPLLLKSGEEKLDARQTETGEITHMLPDVTCEAASTISCVAPGAIENKTATLLVAECETSVFPLERLFLLLVVVV